MTTQDIHNGRQMLLMSGIGKQFSSVPVLDNVHFELNAGEVHILAGENGAGKSTLMKILAGVYTEYTGRIELEGRPIRFNSIHEASAAGIAIIHQELSLVPDMTVEENIFLGREMSRGPWLSKSSMRRHAVKLLSSVGLNVNTSKRVCEYSLGTQQMIEICKALAFESKIIVMDEPTSALTDVEVQRLFAIIDKLKKEGRGIIYITHKMEEIYRIADRITVLRDGRYIGTDTADRLNQTELIKWMVGRELDSQFPRHRGKAGEIVLEVQNFSVPDQNGKPFPAVNQVSFKLAAGEILGIAGLGGSGNSELLNGLFGSYGSKVSGSIMRNGSPYCPSDPAGGIAAGMALLTNDRKATGLVLGMSIVQNTTLASLKKYAPMGWLRPKSEFDCAQRLGQSVHLKAASLAMPVNALSGGNQQKVAIAKWVETGPKILMLDEPTRGVDVGAKHEIYELMNQWTAQGIAIIMISSEMPELLAMSDRIIVMHRGQITAEFIAAQASQEKILSAAMGEHAA